MTLVDLVIYLKLQRLNQLDSIPDQEPQKFQGSTKITLPLKS